MKIEPTTHNNKRENQTDCDWDKYCRSFKVNYIEVLQMFVKSFRRSQNESKSNIRRPICTRKTITDWAHAYAANDIVSIVFINR